jgi:hypothetical protein
MRKPLIDPHLAKPFAPWLLCAVLSCRPNAGSAIQLELDREHKLEFVAETAFAEYVELTGQGRQLTITLASYEASCDRFVPPENGEASVTVSIIAPAGPITAGSYASSGSGASEQRTSDRAYAVPTARAGRKSYLFQPGGAVQITELLLAHRGTVKGVLLFEFPGDAAHPPTAIRGSFQAAICRLNRASGS